MKKSFLICSLHGRLQNLIKLLTSLKEYTDWHIYISLQMYPKEEEAVIYEHCRTLFDDRFRLYSMQRMTGPHLSRCRIFDEVNSDIWCILDDDMWAIKGVTDYDKMANILYEKENIGLLSSNWRRTENMLKKVILQDKLVKQNIVYTGGGMMLRQDLANIIMNIPRVQYLFDNPLWSIYSYVNGYDNYRYLGSAAVHEICTKGGRRKWIKENDCSKALPPAEWIITRKGKGEKGSFDEYLICEQKDITEMAHNLHKENKL